MEYLTLRDIPHRHYNPLRARTMSEDRHRNSEKTLPSMAAVCPGPLLPSLNPPPAPPNPLSLTIPAPAPAPAPPPPPAPGASQSILFSPPDQLPYTSMPSIYEPARNSVLSASEALREPRADSITGAIESNIQEQSHNMRNNSPPIQPGEQRPGNATLPSFQELMENVREQTPPKTPSRRHGSTEGSPIVQAPHFDDVAWAGVDRRRTETISEMHHRPSNASEHHGYDSRRPSAIDPSLASAYNSPRTSHQATIHPPVPNHQHRGSLPYPTQPPSHLSSHARHQSSPIAHGHAAYHSQQAPPQPGINAPAPYAHIPPHHGTPYDLRASYYPEHHPPTHGYPYDRPHDPYYAQPTYAATPHSSYDSAYHPQTQQYNYTFQSTLGMDQNSFNRKRRGNLPKEATGILKTWFNNHRDSPYPTEEEKLQLCSRTGLSMNQVSNWFINARRRAPQKEQRDARDVKEEA